MSRKNVDEVRRNIEAWNQGDADLSLSYASPEIEWMPVGPAAVEPDQEFAAVFALRFGRVVRARAFLVWREALKAVDMEE